jgi:hypothetical protein
LNHFTVASSSGPEALEANEGNGMGGEGALP